MPPKMRLSKRLQAIANYVRPNSLVADIGTDHAYLPVYLLQNKMVDRVYACDIAAEPLERAAETIAKYNLTDQIQTVLSDGLMGVLPISVDTIVIAGLGGDTIAAILEKAPWTKSEDIHLLLQPMTKANDLRRYLYEQGYCIRQECPVAEHGHLYSVMDVYYASFCDCITDVYSYIGKIPFHESQEKVAYLQALLKRLGKMKDGMERSLEKEKQKEARRLKRTIRSIQHILKGIELNANRE